MEQGGRRLHRGVNPGGGGHFESPQVCQGCPPHRGLPGPQLCLLSSGRQPALSELPFPTLPSGYALPAGRWAITAPPPPQVLPFSGIVVLATQPPVSENHCFIQFACFFLFVCFRREFNSGSLYSIFSGSGNLDILNISL